MIRIRLTILSCFETNIYLRVFLRTHGRKLVSDPQTKIITGLPGKPSHKMGFRSSVSKSGHPGEGKHEGLVRRNDVLANGFMGFSLA